MGLYQWALITDHRLAQSRLYNFGLCESDWSSVIERIETHINQQTPKPVLSEFKIGGQNNAIDAFKLLSPWQSNTSKADYYTAFTKIQDYIHAGDCYQVNLAQRFSAQFSGDIFSAYRQLAEANKAPFSAYLNFADHQILCLSPERFIESHERNVTTQPIKGTRPRSDDKVKDLALANELISSEKDRAENLMIVDLLRNDLSRTAANKSVKVKELFGHYRFESVHHLVSTIESELAPQFDNFDLLATTLPGGSITGAPKIRAMEIIESLEPVRRNLYCGIIGYIDFCGNMDTNICIRTLIAKQNRLHCWAGGGLVADSEVDTEYQETFDKVNKILPVLSEVK
jgi:para-aminobenzoate synthetase component I